MKHHPYKWLGLGLGASLGASDFLLFEALNLDIYLGETVVTTPTLLFNMLLLGALGYVIGRLLSALKQLDATQKALVQHEKLAAIGRMSAQVAHEVRNPLGVIRSSAEHIADSMPDHPNAHVACRFIVDEVDRLNGFITVLLDFSRPLALDLRATPLSEIVARARTLAGDRLQAHQLHIQVPAHLTVNADADLLVRLLLGLLLNAAEALEAPGRITIRATPEHIEVHDTGPGVSPQHRAQLFEPFFTTKSQGTGLGLAMARRIAQAHGADLAYHPRTQGACFRLTHAVHA